MELTYETLDGVCEFKLMGAYDYWMANPRLSAAQVAEMNEFHPKHLWREMARRKAMKQEG